MSDQISKANQGICEKKSQSKAMSRLMAARPAGQTNLGFPSKTV
jgi:hypothetical protein